MKAFANLYLDNKHYPVNTPNAATALFEKYDWHVIELRKDSFVAYTDRLFVVFKQYGDGCIGAVSFPKKDMEDIVRSWAIWNKGSKHPQDIIHFIWDRVRVCDYVPTYMMERLNYMPWEIEDKLKKNQDFERRLNGCAC